MDPCVEAALGRDTPLMAARSRSAMRPGRATRLLLVAALGAGAGAASAAYGLWHLLGEGALALAPLLLGPLVLAASAALAWRARAQAREPGPWFVATPRALVLVRPEGARWIPWGALEGVRATAGGDVVVTGRAGVRIEGPARDARCILDVVAPEDPVGFARVCAERIADAQPVRGTSAPREQRTLRAFPSLK